MYKALLLSGLLYFVAFTGFAQGGRVLTLKTGRLAYAPVGYYISNVFDDRTDKGTIGTMDKERIDLQGGASLAIKKYADNNITQDRGAQAISIHIEQLKFGVKKDHNGWTAKAEMTIAFYVNEQKLVELESKGEKEMDGDPADYVDEFIKHALESDLKRFGNWWAQNKSRIPTASVVQVNVVVGKTIDKPNAIVYSVSRPLAIADFQGMPAEGGPELAATLSGIGFASAGETKNGQIVLTVTLTPYFSRSGSWFKKGGQHPLEVLAHERAHFNITALKACELAARIRQSTFTKDNYEQQLDDMMHANTDAAGKEQSLFDEETAHGTIRNKELEWEQKIKDRIAACGCY